MGRKKLGVERGKGREGRVRVDAAEGRTRVGKGEGGSNLYICPEAASSYSYATANWPVNRYHTLAR